jgi:hypothetical protein
MGAGVYGGLALGMHHVGAKMVHRLVDAPHGPRMDKTKNGGAKGSRTPDLVIANDALYQLSYGPMIAIATG